MGRIRSAVFSSYLAVASLLAVAAEGDLGARAAEPSGAAKLIDEALASELGSTPGDRQSLLEKILVEDPNHALARAYLGYVRIDDEWRTVQDAEEPAGDPKAVDKYWQLRDSLVNTPDGHRKLARWCRTHKLPKHARLHWLYVANQQPPNSAASKEAQQALRTEYRSTSTLPYDPAQVAKAAEQFNRDLAKWTARCEVWRDAIGGEDAQKRKQALAELSALDDPAAIPALAQVFISVEDETAVPVVQAMARMSDRRATDPLVRFAIFSQDETVRRTATGALHSRDKRLIVRRLVESMQPPVEVEVRVSRLPRGIVATQFDVYQETAQANFVWSDRSLMRVTGGTRPGAGAALGAQSMAAENATVSRNIAAAQNDAARTVQDAARHNQQARWLNGRIGDVLAQLTDRSFGSDAVAWQEWWLNEDEQPVPEVRPTFETTQVETNYATNIPRHSCFLRGTLVWTETGAMPIEEIPIGHRVLAQNTETGELAYQTVLQTTLRPKSPMKRLVVGGETIVATLGHPFWVAGEGWQMAKQLEAGNRLHGVFGSVTLEEVAEGPDSEAYNLVVAGFHTYFVGRHRLLVHDVSWTETTDKLLPGWAAATESLAAKPAE